MDIDKIIEDACNRYEQDQYALYLRKSRADLEMEALGEGETLARHKNMLMALAEKHNIHPDQITVYKEVVSGDSIQDRPEMQRLLSDVYAKKYKGVLVVEVERLARGNTKDQGEVADAFAYSSTHIITPAKVYDPNNEFDQEYFEFGLFMSRREYKTIKRRLVAGKEAAAREGNYILSRPPFGFNIERKSKKDRYLVENPEQAKYLRMIFDWWTEDGKSMDWIAKQLTSMGVPNYTKTGEWAAVTIHDILRNIHYVGKIKWNAIRTVKQFDPETGLMKKVRQKAKPEDIIIVDGKHEGLISEEQFEKAQERFGAFAKTKTSLTLRNHYAGILRCCKCGKSMTFIDFNDGIREPRIQHGKSNVCKIKSVTFSSVNNAVIAALKEYIRNTEIEMERNNDDTQLVRHQEIVSAMKAELAKQEKKKARLFDSWEADDGTYTKDEFLERKQMYSQIIDNMKEQIKKAEAEAPAPVDYSERIVNLHAMLDCINNPDLTAKEKNDFLKKFIDRIDYDILDNGKARGWKPLLDIRLK